MEVTPVLSIDRYQITEEAGTITNKIHKLYLDAAMGRIEEYRSWLTPIY
jgi:branched-chain amino acid aminotransferase